MHTKMKLFMVLFLLLLGASSPQDAFAQKQEEMLYIASEERPVPYYTPDELPEKLKLATEKDDHEAQYTIGSMLYYGKLIEQDKFKGEKYVEMAAKAGYIPAMTQMAVINQDREAYSLVLEWLFKAVKAGEEKGTPDPWASFMLANYYDKGDHIFQSYKKAKELYEVAAQGGVLNAALKLGYYYQYGKGVDVDLKKAIAYYQYVGEFGYDQFQLQVAHLLQDLYAGLAKDEENTKEIFKWQLKAAQLGDPIAASKVAEAYFEGIGTERNYTEAIKWYEKAAEGGQVNAMVKLGQIHSNGTGTDVDFAKAAKWYQKAAENESSEGAWNLANLYANGLGVQKDPEEAEKWFHRAAALGKPRY